MIHKWLFVASLSTMAWGSVSFAQESPGGLLFDREYINLGRFEAVGDIVEEFSFKVGGTGPVEILDLHASCGCITPILPKRVYQPGESDTLTFGIHGTSQKEGKRRFEVSLSYRQAGQVQRVSLIIDMELFKPIVVEPSNLLLYVNGTTSVHQTITVTDQRPLPLELVEVVSSSTRLQPRVLTGVKFDPAVRQVELSVMGDFPLGKSEERLVIRTADRKFPELVIPVTVIRNSRLKVLPEALHAKMPTNPSKQVLWYVLINDSRGEPIRIESIDVPSSNVKVDYPKETTTKCRVRVAATGGVEAHSLNSEIVIHVAEPIKTVLHLPLRIE
jgi:hypothetical protein